MLDVSDGGAEAPPFCFSSEGPRYNAQHGEEMRPIVRVLVFVTLLMAAFTTNGQTFSCGETIDGLVAGADEVVTGQIVSVSGDHGSDVFGHDWRGVEVSVSDVLKGKMSTTSKVNVALQISASTHRVAPADLQRWMNDGDHLLILVKSDKDGNRWPPLGTVVELGDQSVTMWTPDFLQLHGGREVLSAARDEAKRLSEEGPTAVVCIDKPHDFLGTDLADIMARGLKVPADERLDKRARAIISGELPTPYHEDSRYYAVEALGYRPTADNRTLLLQILHGDDARLRWGAYEALKRMGVGVTPPPN
jgi:hypothetical protein